MSTTDAALSAIASAGLQVNNLFQIAGGQWQANVRAHMPDGKTLFHEYAVAGSPGSALTACLARVPADVLAKLRQASEPAAPVGLSIEDLLG